LNENLLDCFEIFKVQEVPFKEELKGDKMKNFNAIITAFFMTGLIGIVLFGFGFNALINKNTVPTLNSPAANTLTNTTSKSGNTSASQTSNQAQIQQLQNTVTQYQDQLNQAVQEINAQNAQLAQYQKLIQALANSGVIVIRQDGTILIPRR